MNRLMRIFGIVVLILALAVAVLDIFLNEDLFMYWMMGVLIHQFTEGYSYYFEENRKVWGMLIMGMILGAWVFIVVIQFM